jgi:uncharacterized membrane protein affecting hemolysin expression
MQQIFWTYLQQQIVQAVGQTKGAIGYIGLAYETKEVTMRYLMIKEKLLLSHLWVLKIKRIQLLGHYFTCSTRKMLQK